MSLSSCLVLYLLACLLYSPVEEAGADAAPLQRRINRKEHHLKG